MMPSGGQTTNESVLVKWYKDIGDKVQKGDVLFEIETDKATLQIESYAEGVLIARYYNEGDIVSTGEIVGYIGEEGETPPENTGQTENESEDDYQPILKKDQSEKQDKEPEKSLENPIEDSGRVLASPAARHLAKGEKISLEEVAEGLSSRIVKKEDVRKYIMDSKETDSQEFHYIRTSQMRKTIARRMTESVTQAPHFMATVDIDMTRCINLKKKLNEFLKNNESKVSFNDIIMKVVSKAIEKHPLINSSYEGENIKVYKDINFGLAVSIDGGLVVPVVKHVNRKTIQEVAIDNAKNISKARNNQLKPEDMSDGTITLSNLGMFGIDCFTAIINQPESCILAVGQIAEKVVCVNGQIVARHMMTVTASFDHRVIDGAIGAAFLKDVKLLLENPELLLVY